MSYCRWFCRAVLWICCSTKNNRKENVCRILRLSKRISKISIGCASCLMFHKKEEGSCAVARSEKEQKLPSIASMTAIRKPLHHNEAGSDHKKYMDREHVVLTYCCFKKTSNTSSEKKDSFVFPIFHNIVAIKLLTCCSFLFHFSTGVPHPFQEIIEEGKFFCNNMKSFWTFTYLFFRFF